MPITHTIGTLLELSSSHYIFSVSSALETTSHSMKVLLWHLPVGDDGTPILLWGATFEDLLIPLFAFLGVLVANYMNRKEHREHMEEERRKERFPLYRAFLTMGKNLTHRFDYFIDNDQFDINGVVTQEEFFLLEQIQLIGSRYTSSIAGLIVAGINLAMDSAHEIRKTYFTLREKGFFDLNKPFKEYSNMELEALRKKHPECVELSKETNRFSKLLKNLDISIAHLNARTREELYPFGKLWQVFFYVLYFRNAWELAIKLHKDKKGNY